MNLFWKILRQVFPVSIIAGSAIQIHWILKNCEGVLSFNSDIVACQDNLLRLSLGWLLIPLAFVLLTGTFFFIFLPVLKQKEYQKFILSLLPAYQLFYVFILLPFKLTPDVVFFFVFLLILIASIVFVVQPEKSGLLFSGWRIFWKNSLSRYSTIGYSKEFFLKKDVLWLSLLLLSFSGPILQNFTLFHHEQVDDALILGLVSTQKLTFFYWGQSRFAMVLPLLASIIQNPHANFYFLTMFQVTTFFLGAYFLFYLTLGRYAILPFALFSLLMTFLWNAFDWCYYLVPVPILTSLFFLGFGAILIRDKIILDLKQARFSIIFLCMFCGLLMNPSAFLFLVGVFLAYKKFSFTNFTIVRSYQKIGINSIKNRREVNWILCFFLFLFCFFFSFLFSNSGGFAGLSGWWFGMTKLTQNLVKQFAGGWISVAYFFCFTFIILLLYFRSSHSKKSFIQRIYLFILPAILVYLTMPWLKHVGENGYHGRYIVLFWWLIGVFVFSHLGHLLRKIPLKHFRLSGYLVFVTALFVLANKFSIQTSLTSPLEILTKKFNPPMAEIQRNKCQILMGDYKFVWPAVWLLNAKYYDTRPEYYGISRRSEETSSLWVESIKDGAILCALKDDPFYANKEALFVPYMKDLEPLRIYKLYESEFLIFFRSK